MNYIVLSFCVFHVLQALKNKNNPHCARQSDVDCSVEESLSIENTMWANTVVASGTALGVVIYTGGETRAVMNTSQPSSKVPLILPHFFFVSLPALHFAFQRFLIA